MKNRRDYTASRCGALKRAALSALLVASTAAPGAAASSDVIGAAKQGDGEQVKSLLRQPGADANLAEADGTTALHWATRSGNAEVVGLLLAAGAKPNAVNRYGVTPIALAAESGSAVVIEQLLKAGADPNTEAPGGETALMTAARTGRADALRVLLAHGAKANAVESARGQSALMWAAAENHAAAVKVLLEGGADINARSRGPVRVMPGAKAAEENDGPRKYQRKNRVDSMTPLLFGVRQGSLDATRALLDAGANVRDALEDGTSALMLALINQHFELAGLLLDRGASPTDDKKGWTPLHQIVRSRTLDVGKFPHPVATGRVASLDIASKLLAKGADINAKMKVSNMGDGFNGGMDRRGATPLVLAAHGVDHEMLRLLIAHGADIHAKSNRNTSVLGLSAGLEIGNLGLTGGTNEDALIAVQVALDAGLDINAVNDLQETPLHGAAGRGSLPMIELLVAKGARMDVEDGNGCTPVRIAQGDRHACGLAARGNRPDAFALLQKLMAERGMAVDFRSDEELFKFDFENVARPESSIESGFDRAKKRDAAPDERQPPKDAGKEATQPATTAR